MVVQDDWTSEQASRCHRSWLCENSSARRARRNISKKLRIMESESCCAHDVRLPRFDMLPRIVRSPVEICFGTSPSHAPKSRPFENASPVPIAATVALEMIGPMPGTVISRSQPLSCRASASISLDRPSMRSSSRRQSPARSSMTRSMRGDRASQGAARMRGNSARKKRKP
jgi:hypothetical protein